MDDQTWINLQKLAQRGPQPTLFPDERPDHLLLADALANYGARSAQPAALTDHQLMLADALANYGKATPAQPDAASYPALTSDAPFPNSTGPMLQLASYRQPSPGGDAGVAGRAPPDPGTQYTMGSPADVDPPWQSTADQYVTPQPKPAPPAPPHQTVPRQSPASVGGIPDFPETGRDAWRTANDKIFIDAVNRYNAANGYRPGDPGYWTADKLKAQAMVESGGNKEAFLTDPLQVNTHGTWVPRKHTIAGLVSEHQPMTPEISANAALKWLQYKGWHHDGAGNADRYFGDDHALAHYNGDWGYAAKVEAQLNAARQARRTGR